MFKEPSVHIVSIMSVPQILLTQYIYIIFTKLNFLSGNFTNLTIYEITKFLHFENLKLYGIMYDIYLSALIALYHNLLQLRSGCSKKRIHLNQPLPFLTFN